MLPDLTSCCLAFPAADLQSFLLVDSIPVRFSFADRDLARLALELLGRFVQQAGIELASDSEEAIAASPIFAQIQQTLLTHQACLPAVLRAVR
jgi:hypothetical protein